MSGLYQRFKAYIDGNKLLDGGLEPKVVIGVSGGADSVCLLLLFKMLSKERALKIKAVHINHCLRGSDADADEEFVRALCERENIPLKVFKEDVSGYAKENGLGEEEAGREIRYKIFSREAEEGGFKVAVAHHMDDNAETIIHNLIRGADLNGISGMAPEVEMYGCRIIRPLLFAQRSEIEDFLKSMEQKFCTDETNNENLHTRNKIRNIILKEMKDINPGAVSHICRLGTFAKDADDMIKKAADAGYKRAVDKTEDGSLIDIKCLDEIGMPAAGEVVYKAVVELAGGMKDITQIHIEDILDLAELENGKRITLPKGIVAIKQNEKIRLKKIDKAYKQPVEDLPVRIDLSDKKNTDMAVKKINIRFDITEHDDDIKALIEEKNQYTKAFDYDKISGSLFLDTRRPEDMITLKKGKKKINRLMIDKKVPRDDRDDMLLLRDEKETLWVLGLRMSEAYKVTTDTVRVLKVTVTPPEAQTEFA